MKFQSILEAIGRTPLVKINRLFATGAGPALDVYGKCEFLNPGGSVKDRIGYNMVRDAQQRGLISPGDTLIEPTSGNTGIGIALAGAVLGYRVIITLPQKMSQEKVLALEALGAEIIRTPTEAAWDSDESHIGVAKKLNKQIPRSFILDQYINPANPDAHYHATAEEIIADLAGKTPDVLVAGAGTGGTIAGIARRFKEVNPSCYVVGADPEGSIIGGGQDVHSYLVEGIGYDFVPKVCDRSLVDRWVKTNDKESFLYARRAIREEGLLVGGSSGSALSALARVAPDLKDNAVVVVVLPDGIRNYMSKFLDEKWMAKNGFFYE